jgi:hypothetical protein
MTTETRPATTMRIDRTDWASMSLGERIRHFEVEGYVVLPRTLDGAAIERLKASVADAPTEGRPYSEDLRTTITPPHLISRPVAELIAHPPTIEFLRALLGDDIVFTMSVFQTTYPGAPGIVMHTDGHPFGSSIFDFEGSSPRLLRVIYYLDDLIPPRAPFRLVPRSHLSFHADANPYLRYESHPEEVALCLDAGSALIFPKDLFHATHPNVDSQPRSMIQLGYRPGWAGPIGPCTEWDPEWVVAAPAESRPFLQSRNKTGGRWLLEHRPAGMQTAAPGIDPSRWDR